MPTPRFGSPAPSRHLSCCVAALAAAAAVSSPDGALAEDAELPLVVHETFDDGAGRWEPTDVAAWKAGESDGKSVYELTKKKSDYQPPHRSPHNISLLKGHAVGDFVLTAKVKTTEPAYGHRSLCLFFGYVDESHFYYVHFGQEADDHANQVFIVNGAPRTKISTSTTDGTPWEDGKWHDVKIVRRVSDGTIEVYFDDMEKPAMTAEDKTFAQGRIGIGSFDDRGMWDEVVVRGVEAE